jgi:hypothetical protein
VPSLPSQSQIGGFVPSGHLPAPKCFAFLSLQILYLANRFNWYCVMATNNNTKDSPWILPPIRTPASNSPRTESVHRFSKLPPHFEESQRTEHSTMGTMTLPMHTNAQWADRDRPITYGIPSTEPRSAAANVSLPSIHKVCNSEECLFQLLTAF